jgi:hypothetical protein
MSFSHLNRRLHLYLGLALAPWVLMYGISSVPFAHSGYFDARDRATGQPLWRVHFERPFDRPAPAGGEALRAFGDEVLRELAIDAPNTGVFRAGPAVIDIYAYSFLKWTRVQYRTDLQTIRVEERRFRWDQFLTGLHARGGFDQDGWLPTAWSVLVDVVCISFLLWIASGVYMWWGLRPSRRLGWCALLAGALAFTAFALGL